MLVRAQPFKDMPYHDKTRTDFIMWRTPYCTITDEDLDLTKPEHVAQVGYGRVVLLFQCAIAANSNTDHQIMDLAFIEELWRYSPLKQDQLDSEYGCTLLYQTSPAATFYVIPANKILGPAAISRNSAPPRIPPGGLRGCRHTNPCARADTGPDDSSGSPLYRLNIWHMMWGSMIGVRALEYRLPGALTPEQQVRRRRNKAQGCAVRVPGHCSIPMPKSREDDVTDLTVAGASGGEGCVGGKCKASVGREGLADKAGSGVGGARAKTRRVSQGDLG